ncbi:cingulin-like [Mizuhopecten yessoensis]|uniref:CARD domain-containing protein n=1 Tax=Mizuhopecten yessoensis TaxID=6573 RepID=A0A210Q4B3_MIZYE|nr:cingulin-like [Mizuhopecten yessoensis]OWF43577.1 hypothetical protein KP79_PYT11221 [Mizuhopecten yessoensis]
MNREQKKRITQNITCLKERLVDLDPIIDILIERDVLTMEHRNRIEQIACPTSHRKFNEFMSVLLASPDPNAYYVLIEALQTERHFFLVDKLQNTVVKESPYNATRTHTYTPGSRETGATSRQSASRHQTRNVSDGAGASGIHRAPNMVQQDLSYQMSNVLAEFCEKMTENFAVQLQKERRHHQEDMDKRIEEKFTVFQKDWCDQKEEILQRNEDAINHLQECVDKLHQSNVEYQRLREKYDKLKSLQRDMRDKENERWNKLTKSNMDNVLLRKENDELRRRITGLQDQVLDLNGEIRVAKDNENQDRTEIERLTVENKKLEQELEDKGREADTLKREAEEAYSKIHTDMRTQRNSYSSEENDYKEALERQNTKLDAIFAVMDELKSTDKVTAQKIIVPRTVTIGGSLPHRSQKTTKK